jgi:hypothetical protein
MIKPIWKEIDGERWFKFNSNYDKLRYFYGNILTLILVIVLIVLGILIFYYVGHNLALLKSNPCSLCEKAGYICNKFNLG